MLRLSLVVGLLAALHGVVASSLPTECLRLTDHTFEHDTQAATGQTTGVWAVFFSAPSIRNNELFEELCESLASDEEKEVIYAKVNMAHSKALATRFGELLLPTVAVFRNRKMYVYDGPLDAADALEKIKHFANEGYEASAALAVPDVYHRKTLEEMQPDRSKDRENRYTNLWLGLGCILVAVVFRTYVQYEKDNEEKAKEALAKKGKAPAAAGAASGAAAGGKAKAAADAAAGSTPKKVGGKAQ